MRQDLALFRLCIKEVCALRFGEEIHGPRAISEVDVGHNADNLVHSRVISRSGAEVLPNHVLPAKEPFGKRLVDHGYGPCARVVVIGDGPSHYQPLPKSLEKSRRHTGPTG